MASPSSAPLRPSNWQTEFTQSLFQGLSEPLKHTIEHRSEAALNERFSIYQNNVFYSLTTALADLYPTIKKLVGEEFFNGTANAYIRQNPPTQAAMVYFGSTFPQFLLEFEHTQSMPYLSDVAQLELARHQAYHAANTPALDAEFFTQVNAEAFEQSTVEFHPSVALLDSNFPIFTIWQSNQELKVGEEANTEMESTANKQGTINLDEPEWLIVVRHNYEIVVFNIDYATYLFYTMMMKKKSIIEAANAMQQKENKSDISAAITLGIQHHFFTRIFTS